MMRNETFDLIGVGFGPANIALAVALEERGWSGRTLFLERSPAPDWQPEMLLDGSDIQHNPLRDFVTPRNPRSPYGFLSFLHREGRLFDYLNLDVAYALRKDYAAYVRWVARHFDRWVSYGESVASLRPVSPEASGSPLVEVITSAGRRLLARAVSLAPGRSPLVPAVYAPHLGDRIVHFTGYLSALARWRAEGLPGSVAVVGASQSAVEIILDLHRRHPDLTIHSVQRGFGFHLKDVSPFIEKAYYPDFVDYYFGLNDARKRAMTADLWRSNYGAADADVIHALNLALYEQKLDGRRRIEIHTSTNVTGVGVDAHGVRLDCHEHNLGTSAPLHVGAVILATGFRNFGAGDEQELAHPLLRDLAAHADRHADGTPAVTRDYRLAAPAGTLPPIFVNGLNESTHGFGDAGSFSLLALRSGTIAAAIEAAAARVAPGAREVPRPLPAAAVAALRPLAAEALVGQRA